MVSALPRWINSPRRRATSSDLFIDVTASRYVQRGPNAYTRSVQGSWTWLGNVAATVHLLVVDRMLVVVVSLQGQFSAADRALETTRVKEREVLQWTDSVHLVDGLSASQTRALVKIRPIHRLPRSGSRCLGFRFLIDSSVSSVSAAPRCGTYRVRPWKWKLSYQSKY